MPLLATLTSDDILRAADGDMLCREGRSVVLSHHLVGDELMMQPGSCNCLKGLQPISQHPTCSVCSRQHSVNQHFVQQHSQYQCSVLQVAECMGMVDACDASLLCEHCDYNSSAGYMAADAAR